MCPWRVTGGSWDVGFVEHAHRSVLSYDEASDGAKDDQEEVEREREWEVAAAMEEEEEETERRSEGVTVCGSSCRVHTAPRAPQEKDDQHNEEEEEENLLYPSLLRGDKEANPSLSVVLCRGNFGSDARERFPEGTAGEPARRRRFSSSRFFFSVFFFLLLFFFFFFFSVGIRSLCFVFAFPLAFSL